VLADLAVFAAAAKARRQESARRERQWQLDKERRLRQERREELLEEQLKHFAQLESLERYLIRLERSVDRSKVPRLVRAYLAWCHREADELRATCSIVGIKPALAEGEAERLRLIRRD
jgi:uncharacterized protein YlxW (UPF0749 family)